ncbi:hypothetical protein BGZ49_001911 [Haplosporangium sp. Z 27]|nr:hypothetical protein BGZ49_001911 [Haplosporangium sp. Z 27]
MSQLLESTRNYLKVSTKIGRRLSSYRDDSSASETSLHVPSSSEDIKQKQFRASPQNRLSSLFTIESRHRSSVSSEDRPASTILSSKAESEIQDQPQKDSFRKRRNSSSRKSTKSTKSSKSLTPPSLRTSQYMDHNEVPRGRSPTFSVASTVRSAGSSAASIYDARPGDYPSVDAYNSHVWRRTLLEESIMQSLNLGYGLPAPQPSPQRRSRSLKRSATGRESVNGKSVRKTVIDRNASTPNRILAPQQENKVINKNSPYQMLNPSTSNITQSYTSFTLELPEHQVKHVIRSSVVPGLFSLKMDGDITEQQQVDSKENMDPIQMPQAVAATAV